MKVYKFGGASVRSAEGIKNMVEIIRYEKGDLFVIVSAMGKTTNALERVVEAFMADDKTGAKKIWMETELYHREICSAFFGSKNCPAGIRSLFGEVWEILEGTRDGDYDKWYDTIVSYGELLSTAIISAYLNSADIGNELLDSREYFVTDSRHRDASIDIEASAALLRGAVTKTKAKVIISQGFIGADRSKATTTLGREGSDYSGAVAANILDAESLTIWKDVEGILTADPKFFPDAVYIPELTYLDAIELAYSGAQIIHPKTIKPLQNKDIPLYVRPFSDASKPGSVIKGEISEKTDLPILILKKNQVLLSIRPRDFSFVLEDRFARIFSIFESNGIKINLIQSSAVNLSLCVDASRHLGKVVEDLKNDGYRVVYNDHMQLLTIRGYSLELYEKYDGEDDVFLTQKTRRTLRVVRRGDS